MVGLIFGILRYDNKKKNSYKQTEKKWQKRGKMKTKKTNKKKETACWVLSLTIAHKVINLVKLLLNSAFVSSKQLTTPENTITYHNALCLSPQNFA